MLVSLLSRAAGRSKNMAHCTKAHRKSLAIMQQIATPQTTAVTQQAVQGRRISAADCNVRGGIVTTVHHMLCTASSRHYNTC
jgi:hypothetical protein